MHMKTSIWAKALKWCVTVIFFKDRNGQRKGTWKEKRSERRKKSGMLKNRKKCKCILIISFCAIKLFIYYC